MTSHRIEKQHESELKQLLLDSGLTCIRTTVVSEHSSVISEETEKDESFKEVEEEHAEIETEEETTFIPEEIEVVTPDIFPTPSLRRVLPDKIRIIEKQNRIHVLPETFKGEIDAFRIPKIISTPPQKYINELAEITGCKSYKNSLSEYWFLDSLANLLRRAQEDHLDKETQAVLIQWFCEWMKEMQHFDAADRQRMLKRFKDNMLSAASYVVKENRVPTPVDLRISYQAEDDIIKGPSDTPIDSKHLVTFEEFQCSLFDLTKILHYIFDLFSSDFQYDLIRSVFTFTPEYQLIDAPHRIQNPKRFYTPLKAKGKEKTVKKEREQSKTVKGKKKEIDTEEYLHFLQVQCEIEREKEEEAERDREDWNRRSHVLPLAFAVNDEFFDKYWPPASPEIASEPEPEVKGKGKKK